MSITPSGAAQADLLGTANEIAISPAGTNVLMGSTNITLSLPDDVTIDGFTLNDLTASRLLSSNGSKVLTSVADLASWIAGTANRVTVTNDGDGTITLTGPQDLATGSSPTFAALTLTADLTVANGGTGASSLEDIVGTANEITVTAGADSIIGGDVTLSLPDDVSIDGLTLDDLTASRLLSSNGSKVLTSTDLNSWITGTANRISVADDGDGTITLSAPQDIATGSAVTFVTVNTGEGANELFDMNQDVQSDDAVTFVTVNTGQGANELYDMNQDVQSDDAVTFVTVNTGQGANELYDMDQDVMSSSSPTFNVLALTTDLGITYGGTGASSLDDILGTANEVEVSAGADTVIGGDVTIGLPTAVTVGTLNTGQGANELYDMNQNVQTGDGVTFATVNTGQGANELYDMDQNVTTTSNVEFADAALDGNVDLGDASGDFITVVGKIDADILPYTSATPGLGDASNYWTDAYITDLFVGNDITMGTTDRLILDDTAGDGPVFISHARLEQASANGWYNVLTYTFHATDAAVSIFWILTVWTSGHDRAVYKGLDLFYNLGGTEYKQSGWADFVVENNTSFSYAVAVTSYGLRVAAYVDESDDTTFDLWYVITESEE